MRPGEMDMAQLIDMLEHARGVMRAVAHGGREAFDGNEDFRLAIERRIEIIGEAARGVSKEFQAAHPGIPWRKVIAQRHILAHDYGIINYDLLWKVAAVHIPEMAGVLEGMVGEEGK